MIAQELGKRGKQHRVTLLSLESRDTDELLESGPRTEGEIVDVDPAVKDLDRSARAKAVANVGLVVPGDGCDERRVRELLLEERRSAFNVPLAERRNLCLATVASTERYVRGDRPRNATFALAVASEAAG